MLCDLYTTDAEPVALSTRQLLRGVLADLDAATGLRLRAGLELELHLYRPAAVPGAKPEPLHPGWDLLGEPHADLVEPHVEPIRAALAAIGHEPRSIEIELGPGQLELTFAACDGMAAADQAVLVRSTIRQVARRNGLHATFMSRPGVGDAFPSGWHLHQSLVGADGANAFAGGGRHGLSPLAEQWLAGLQAHAEPSCLLTTPTVTGYKRYRPQSVAPDRITWSVEHRGAMLRLVGGPAAASTHVENRVGDPAANPYLYLASQVVSGLDGIRSSLAPGPPDDSPYDADAGRRLPRSLLEAIVAFEASPLYRRAFGDEVVGYLATLARSSWDRFAAHVTDWEQREYFELF
jgi:glutamine synthetase